VQVGAPNYEIIVTDDSISENSKNLVKNEFPQVQWGNGKKIGPAGNRNAGVERAKGEWIVFIDDDCIAQKSFLTAYAKAIKNNPRVLVFEGKIFANRLRKTWAEGCPENEFGGMLWTSNLCVKRNLFKQMGGLDERFKVAYEDVEFATRLKKQNVRAIFVSNASVCHPWRTLRQEGKNWKKNGYQFRELLIFLEKHPDQFQFHSPQLFIRHALRSIFKEIPQGFMSFKGRGTVFKLIKTFYSLKASFLLLKFRFTHQLAKK